jgi:hypothetical protein
LDWAHVDLRSSELAGGRDVQDGEVRAPGTHRRSAEAGGIREERGRLTLRRRLETDDQVMKRWWAESMWIRMERSLAGRDDHLSPCRAVGASEENLDRTWQRRFEV